MMPSKTTLSFVVFALVLIVAAGVIRSAENGYHLFLAGDYQGAHTALSEQATAGDGFAAYLKGRTENKGRLGRRDTAAALKSFRQAAELGYPDGAVMDFWLGAELAAYTPKACDRLKAVLESGAQARNLMAAAYGGDLYRYQSCGPADPVRAARYYGLAARLDPRLGTKLDSLLVTLTGDQLLQAQTEANKDFPATTIQEFLERYRALKTN